MAALVAAIYEHRNRKCSWIAGTLRQAQRLAMTD